MNTVQTIASDLEMIQASHIVDFVHLIEHGRRVLKARGYISSDLFLQVYRNDRFGTTNFALILGDRRIYGRDEREGSWHRHPVEDSDSHDESDEGRREVTLKEFWEETLTVIDNLGLIL